MRTATTGFIFNVNVCDLNISDTNSNFEGNFSNYVFFNVFWQFRELKNKCWTWLH